MKKFKEFINENKYIAQIEFETYDADNEEVLDDELYGEIEITANDEDDAQDKIDHMRYSDFSTQKHPNGKIISYVELKKI